MNIIEMTFDEHNAGRTLAMEVRGEPPEAQSAVAHVLINRLKTGKWGHTLAAVCLWRNQFSGWAYPSDPNFAYACGLRDDDPVLVKMLGVLHDAPCPVLVAPSVTAGTTTWVDDRVATTA